ncbi:MAG TPA: hypothetical protein VLC09_06260 [Polyangiaceae bacterium]|nr:hypothetical protein [Polyangiaceae bacterium]
MAAVLTGVVLGRAPLARALPPSAIPETSGSESHVAQDASPRLGLFVSCADECFQDFLRQELNYFDFSRDPHRADRVVIVSRQPSASGGERFTVRIESPLEPAAPSLEPQAFVAPAGATDRDKREQLAQTILRMLLLGELQAGRQGDDFHLTLPRRSGEALEALQDPWDYWVFAPEMKASGEGGSGYYFVNGDVGLTVRRVTDEHKIRLGGGYGQQWSSYLVEDGSRLSGAVGRWDARALYARSVGKHFALGGVATARGSEFENLKGHVHGGPLAEWNFFPYSENASQQLRLAYQAGPWANWYHEANPAGLLQEVRPYHALSLIADANQVWGSLQWIGQANQFLDEPTLYRLATGAIFSLRLYEGLAISFEGEASWVQDLINLRGRPITDDELLLWTAQQPTDWIVEGIFGLNYTFGSIHNTIVNPRFERIDLEDD